MSVIVFVAAVSTGLSALQLSVAEVHGPFRRMIRADPLVDAVVEAMTVKNHGCPIQELTVNTDPMRVMKEVEPFWSSEPADAYLEVHLACSDAVRAVVHSYYNDRQGGEQPLAKRLRKIEFSYAGFVDRYLVTQPSAVTTPEHQVLNDPVLAKIYPVLAINHKKCDDLASGKLTVADKPQGTTGGWNGQSLEYRVFHIDFTCPAEGSGTTYRFTGKYFAASGYVTWDELIVGGWVQ